MFVLGKDKFGATPLVSQDVKKELRRESKNLDSIGCFLLSHSYLEAYMKELFIYSNEFSILTQNEKELLFKDSDKNIDFKGLNLYHLANKNINYKQYSKIKKINLFRNTIAHRLLENQIHSNQFKQKINFYVEESLTLIELFKNKYKQRLDELEEQF